MSIDRLRGADGLIVGAAADHRDSLRIELAKRGLEVSDAELGAIKARVAATIAPAATVILLDGEVGAPAARAAGVFDRDDGPALVLPLEAQGYGDAASVSHTRLLEDFSPAKAVEQGAAACKLLLPFRVDVPDQADRQEAVAAGAADACRAAGIPLVLEPIVYRRPGEELRGFGDLVVAGTARLARIAPGILKVQHPGSVEGCRELDRACGGEPWVLLGGGADEETLAGQIREACAAGAIGFIVGRTLWTDALVPDAAERERILAERALPRLERLAEAARAGTAAARHGTSR